MPTDPKERDMDDYTDAIDNAADPFAEWWSPGYPTEMDEMNAMEANDYMHEFDDLDWGE